MQQIVGTGRHPDEDAHGRVSSLREACSEAVPGVPGVFDCRPDRLQEQSLLGIHGGGLFAGDIEERRVELVVVLQEATPLAIDPAAGGRFRVGIVELLAIPAVRRNQLDQVFALAKVLPVSTQVVRARIAAVDSDDGDGFALIRNHFKRGRALRGHALRRLARWSRGRVLIHRRWFALRWSRGFGRAEKLNQRGLLLPDEVVCKLIQRLVLVEQRLRKYPQVRLESAVESRDHDRLDSISRDPLADVYPLWREFDLPPDQGLQITPGLVEE